MTRALLMVKSGSIAVPKIAVLTPPPEETVSPERSVSVWGCWEGSEEGL